ncbi:MAG: methyltransferase domain-containing protein [Planctomycetes bacterium]|nr:methyltransferase domain-containing protein [Planctomycetota bacterium]
MEPDQGITPADYQQLPTQVGYDRWASIYDEEDNPLIALEEPEVARLLGDVRGLTVLDVGCGTGRHALRLAEAGASVTAVDFSEGMLNQALAKRTTCDVTFAQHDVQTRLPFEDGAFDRVLSALVLEHIADPTAFLGELGRVCHPSGFVVVSAMHPAMMLRGITARFTDPESGRETRPQSYPHQVSDYVMAAVGAGLSIDQISEHVVLESLAARMERARRYLGWPMLMMLRLRPGSA